MVKLKEKIMKNKPEFGKVYALTGGTGQPSIANGYTWVQSEVTDKLVSIKEIT